MSVEADAAAHHLSHPEDNPEAPARGVLTPVILLLSSAFGLLTAFFPFARAAFFLEVQSNEGWNIYNAERIAHHLQLYPVAYGLESVNYPMLSFALAAWLHRLTHDYLFTGRCLSLAALVTCCILVGAIVRRLGGCRTAAWLTGFLCLALFCTSADAYVGVDDPQLLAHAFFLLGFWIYLRKRESLSNLAAVAVLFVIAGNIKHNPVDFSITVLLDLLLTGRRRGARTMTFCIVGGACAAASVALNLHFGGPFFLTELLAPRPYTLAHLLGGIATALGPLLIPTSFATLAAPSMLHDPQRRIAVLLLLTSFAVGALFGGGTGVNVNAFFSFYFAVVILLGLMLSDLELCGAGWRSYKLLGFPLRTWAAPVLMIWMIIPASVAGIANPFASLRATALQQHRFRAQVAFLQALPGPVLCESLLRCYFAGKPYVYDPYNANRFILLHKVDPLLVVNPLEREAFAAVELRSSTIGAPAHSTHFTPQVLAAIHDHYHPAITSEDDTLYLPNPPASGAQRP